MLMFRGRKGFTLIEMMIVIAIIALLATIAIPNYINFQKKAKTAEAKTNLGGIRTCEEAYRAEKDTYINCAACPSTAPGATGGAWDAGATSNWTKIGFEPRGDVRYQYIVVSADASDFTARANATVLGLGTYEINATSAEITEVVGIQ